jgi:hypothetical protein
MRRASRRSQASRRILALLLVTVAVCMLVLEPIPAGFVLLSLTETHGVDVGDLPGLTLLLVAGWLAR